MLFQRYWMTAMLSKNVQKLLQSRECMVWTEYRLQHAQIVSEWSSLGLAHANTAWAGQSRVHPQGVPLCISWQLKLKTEVPR